MSMDDFVLYLNSIKISNGSLSYIMLTYEFIRKRFMSIHFALFYYNQSNNNNSAISFNHSKCIISNDYTFVETGDIIEIRNQISMSIYYDIFVLIFNLIYVCNFKYFKRLLLRYFYNSINSYLTYFLTFTNENVYKLKHCVKKTYNFYVYWKLGDNLSGIRYAFRPLFYYYKPIVSMFNAFASFSLSENHFRKFIYSFDRLHKIFGTCI